MRRLALAAVAVALVALFVWWASSGAGGVAPIAPDRPELRDGDAVLVSAPGPTMRHGGAEVEVVAGGAVDVEVTVRAVPGRR